MGGDPVVVFSSTDTERALALAAMMSCLPSPLTHPNATELGSATVGKVCWGLNNAVGAPGVVVFRSTDTVLSLKLATTRSGLPSPLTSNNATDSGSVPVATFCWGAKDAVGAPGV